MTPDSSRDYNLTLSAGEEKTMPIDGNFIRIKSTTGTIAVTINGGTSDMTTTDSKRYENYTKITFKNNGVSAIQAVYVAGFGGFDNNTFSGTVTLTPGGSFSTPADITIGAGSSVAILAASSTRKGFGVVASTANSSIVRVGDVNVGSARGIPLQPGQPFSEQTSGAVYVHNPGTAAKTVHVYEITT